MDECFCGELALGMRLPRRVSSCFDGTKMTQSGESIDERRMVLCGIGVCCRGSADAFERVAKVYPSVVAKFLSHHGRTGTDVQMQLL